MIVAGLASIIIGEALIKPRTVFRLTLAAVLGSVIYRMIIVVGLRLGLAPTDLKMATGLMVVLAPGGSLPQGRATDQDPPEGGLMMAGGEPMDRMLALEKVTKIFNKGTQDEKVALDGLDLTIKKGEFVTIIGSNGAGKSTLLNVVAGTHKPDKGAISIAGEDVTKAPEHSMAAYLARVFQNPTLGTAATMSIEENLSLAELRGRRRGLKWGVTPARRKRYREILGPLELGLENRLKDKVGLLSGGQRQSLSLLMTILIAPRLLLLDEHTAALDPKTAQKVMDLTNKMVEENNLTTLMVTHNMNQAIRYGNRMVMLHQGRVQLDVRGREKTGLTVAEVVSKFGQTLKDETLFTAGEG